MRFFVASALLACAAPAYAQSGWSYYGLSAGPFITYPFPKPHRAGIATYGPLATTYGTPGVGYPHQPHNVPHAPGRAFGVGLFGYRSPYSNYHHASTPLTTSP